MGEPEDGPDSYKAAEDADMAWVGSGATVYYDAMDAGSVAATEDLAAWDEDGGAEQGHAGKVGALLARGVQTRAWACRLTESASVHARVRTPYRSLYPTHLTPAWA